MSGGSAGLRTIIAFPLVAPPTFSIARAVVCVNSSILARVPGPADLLAILAAMGISAGHDHWLRPGGADYDSFEELTDVTRRRLCLPPERADEVAQALGESGIDPQHPVDLGSSGREVFTIWWDGGE